MVTMLLGSLPERGRRLLSFSKITQVTLRGYPGVRVGLGAEEPASHLQNELRSHSFPMYILVSPALGNHSVQPLPYQPSAGISAQPENPAHLPRAKGSQEPSPKSAVCADGQGPVGREEDTSMYWGPTQHQALANASIDKQGSKYLIA